MTAEQDILAQQRQTVAELMLAVAGESVSVIKRAAPEQALKLKRQEEWGIYLEFLRVMFNLVDRVSALHVPLKEQPQFMDQLTDAVIDQLKKVLEPAFGAGEDQTEIVLTIGMAVSESRQTYERYRFLVTEDSAGRNDLYRDFSERIARALGVPGNPQVTAAATLCISAVIPALCGIFEGQAPPGTAEAAAQTAAPRGATGTDIKLVSVMSSIKGEEVETRWGLHPRFRQDLTQEEAKQLTATMNRVAKILGERYATVAFSDQWASWHKAGHA
ncbi:hypothetical protein FBQ96_10985 [Nitrospirales bacterium NOB]|nr:hypothetical protein [Nitrospirota bacterium]MCE7965386.1 hypothetical protein [Nitrospira sp. NTP2]MCK6499195.1 hypothetical protein [Nitrospira sp.]MDL1890085.1 hypothetical protein [Nitrospirales bacterium NOB]MEB2338960.1 hypothetical protein [Nitrospirales bacterium]